MNGRTAQREMTVWGIIEDSYSTTLWTLKISSHFVAIIPAAVCCNLRADTLPYSLQVNIPTIPILNDSVFIFDVPLNPRSPFSDRKADFLFVIKDFIHSYEPSSWRYDVEEEINGHPQVVDFTSDTTGAPHELAQSNMSMYVNEVGHDMTMVENVIVSVNDLNEWMQ